MVADEGEEIKKITSNMENMFALRVVWPPQMRGGGHPRPAI